MNLQKCDLRKIPIANRFIVRALCPFIAAISCTMVISSGFAQEPVNSALLTLDMAVQRTLEQHPQLSVYVHKLEAYQGLVDQAGVGERLQVDMEIEDFAGDDRYQSFDNAQSTLSLRWIAQGARRDSRIQAAQAASSQVEIQHQIAALDLSAQTARFYIKALVEEQRLILAQKTVKQAKNNVAAIKRRVDIGSSPEFEHLQAKAERAQQELEAEDLQHEIVATRYQLAAQWGGERTDFRLLGDVFKIPAMGSVEQQFEQLKQHPSLELFVTQQRIAESEMALARIEANPQWQFSVGVRRYEATEDFGMVAGISVPLGKDRSSEGKIRSLQARQAEYDSESAALQRQMNTRLYVLLQEINHSQHVIETLNQQVIPALSDAQAQATRAFETGRLGYQQWSAIQYKKLAAQQDLLTAYEAIHLQHIELQRLTGTALTF